MNRPRGEVGATMFMVAASMLLLMGVIAIVVDLAVLRYDIRADRLATDAATTAAVTALNLDDGSGASEACVLAWDYLMVNLEGSAVPGGIATDCLNEFSSGCNPLQERTLTRTAGPYEITVVQPVPDDHAFMVTQPLDYAVDGTACQRLGVAVERVREHAFAAVIGSSSSATRVRSVARIDPDAGEGEVVPLLVLEPIDCAAVYTSGQGKVTVSYDDDSDTPGFIVIDSDASTCGSPNPYSIDSLGTQKGWIRAIPVPPIFGDIPSAILSYALAGEGSADPARAYDPSDVTDPVNPADITDDTEPPESWFRLYPEPSPVSRRITRAPIDWRYNCKPVYLPYPLDLDNEGLGGIPVPGCPDPEATYIDDLVDELGSDPPPTQYQTWTDFYTCSVGSGTLDVTPQTATVGNNWYVDCPGGFVVNGATVRFHGSNVVFGGGIDIRSSGILEINADEDADYEVFIRNGTILKRAQSSLVLGRTFVYLADGAVDLRAGSGGLVWTAPEEGNFEDLALWSEGRMPHEIGGQAGNTLTGTFFTPFAEPFSLTGQGGQVQFEAQFITRRLEVKGQGEVRMIPNPDKTTKVPIRSVRLIR